MHPLIERLNNKLMNAPTGIDYAALESLPSAWYCADDVTQDSDGRWYIPNRVRPDDPKARLYVQRSSD